MRCERDGFQIDAAIRKGRELPPWYLEEPLLMPGDDFYLRAFYQLNSCRQYQYGPIPWTLIAQYSAAWGMRGGMANHFTVILRQLDTAYIEWWVEEQDRQAKLRDQQRGSGKRR